ncbi:MAG: glycosyltransferase family 4 protein [Candidatus Pacebacteria bacterium CG10_big_fil_rev_8_21_14_0_10_45_6]|nr:MAG: glycosyltransferase family 4 protein [Candidatus Pacebacteria bacterium CG10_big_fil_rev_8_21_14_0_10_45_6]
MHSNFPFRKRSFNMQKKQQKVALVHDYLREYGGAERVLESLHELYPEAPVFTAFVDQKQLGLHWQRFVDWDIRTTWLTKIPGYTLLFSPLRIWAPNYFKALDLSEFDLVISSSNAYFAKAVIVPNGKHVCYCHTPARSLYGYTTMSNWRANPITRVFGTLINHYLRVVDYYVAQKVDFFIANSWETARRITKFYRRDSIIIYPPVHIPAQPPLANDRSYYLYVNRLALAKHPELAVQVCTEQNLPLKVVGSGKMLAGLQAMAGSSIEFCGAVSDEKLNELYAGAKALLYPVEDEDFGIVPVEAMAHGVPVIAHDSGGPRETVLPGRTGVLFSELSAAGLWQAMQQAEKSSFSPLELYKHSQQFSLAQFKKKITEFIAQLT